MLRRQFEAGWLAPPNCIRTLLLSIWRNPSARFSAQFPKLRGPDRYTTSERSGTYADCDANVTEDSWYFNRHLRSAIDNPGGILKLRKGELLNQNACPALGQQNHSIEPLADCFRLVSKGQSWAFRQLIGSQCHPSFVCESIFVHQAVGSARNGRHADPKQWPFLKDAGPQFGRDDDNHGLLSH
jgi:hypothetical protein